MALDTNINRIKFLRSTAAGTVPSPSLLADGELALNLADRTIYSRNGESVVELGFGKGGSVSGEITAPSFKGPLKGNADTASKLRAPITINMGEDTSGSAVFDGSQNFTIFTTVNAVFPCQDKLKFSEGAAAQRRGLTIDWVSNESGFPSYGTVLTAKGYSAGGSTLQLYVPYSPSLGGDSLQYRTGIFTTGSPWSALKTIVDDSNVRRYAPGLDGTGATGSWNINVESATRLQSARKINGESFNGINDITILAPTFNGKLISYQATDYNDITGGVTWRYGTQGAANKPNGMDHAVTTMAYDNAWSVQQAYDWRTNDMYIRSKNNGSWMSWKKLATSNDMEGYALPLAGGKMTGTINTRDVKSYATVGELAVADIPMTIPQVNASTTGYIPYIYGSNLMAAGFVVHTSIGAYRGSGGWNDNGLYLAMGTNDARPTEAFMFTNGANVTHTSGYVNVYGLNAQTAKGKFSFESNNEGSFISHGTDLYLRSYSYGGYQMTLARGGIDVGSAAVRLTTIQTPTIAPLPFLSGGSAIGINIGQLLVSNAYSDVGNVPKDGAWIKGKIVGTSGADIVGKIHASNGYGATELQNVKPSNLTPMTIQPYFASLGGLTGAANTTYLDLLTLNTWSDASGGQANALAFLKGSKKIYHYQAATNATSWGTASELAYVTDNVASATKLANARQINGTPFDGTQDVLVGSAMRGTISNQAQLDAAREDGKYQVNGFSIGGLYSYGILEVAATGSNVISQTYTAHQSAGDYGIRIASRQTWNGGTWSEWGFCISTDASRLSLSGGTVNGQVNASSFSLTNTLADTGIGIGLYGSNVGGGKTLPDYGLAFAGTPTFGQYGKCNGDWATYFTMQGGTGSSRRGWIFKAGKSGTGDNVASINQDGEFSGKGYYLYGSNGAGNNFIRSGAADAAGFSANNIEIGSHWGIGFTNNTGATTAYIDTRAGNLGLKGNINSNSVNTTRAEVTTSDSLVRSGFSQKLRAKWVGAYWAARQNIWLSRIGTSNSCDFELVMQSGGQYLATNKSEFWVQMGVRQPQKGILRDITMSGLTVRGRLDFVSDLPTDVGINGNHSLWAITYERIACDYGGFYSTSGDLKWTSVLKYDTPLNTIYPSMSISGTSDLFFGPGNTVGNDYIPRPGNSLAFQIAPYGLDKAHFAVSDNNNDQAAKCEYVSIMIYEN